MKFPRIRVCVVLLMLTLVVCVLSMLSCTTNHYFSVSAEEMTNPRIEYKDSTNLQKLW